MVSPLCVFYFSLPCFYQRPSCHAERHETIFAGAVLYADYVVVRWIVLQTMVRTYTADVRRTANEQKRPILIFQGDSLWGSLHVLLFNTVSEERYILRTSLEVPNFQIGSQYFQVIFLLFLAHGRAVFSDPGIVPLPKHR